MNGLSIFSVVLLLNDQGLCRRFAIDMPYNLVGACTQILGKDQFVVDDIARLNIALHDQLAFLINNLKR